MTLGQVELQTADALDADIVLSAVDELCMTSYYVAGREYRIVELERSVAQLVAECKLERFGLVILAALRHSGYLVCALELAGALEEEFGSAGAELGDSDL